MGKEDVVQGQCPKHVYVYVVFCNIAEKILQYQFFQYCAALLAIHISYFCHSSRRSVQIIFNQWIWVFGHF